MNLNGIWKLYYYENGSVTANTPAELAAAKVASVPCAVPGNVELDLSAAGVLPGDLFKGMNIETAEQVESYDWWYETDFTPQAPAAGQTVLLHFGGVDCTAEYFLNGQSIGKSNNMLIAHEFEVTSLLNYGQKNTLMVHITSPLAAVQGKDYDLDMIAYSWHNHPLSGYMRKAPHAYGWDIMPRALSAGLWRGVELVYREPTYFKFTQFELQRIEGNCGKAALYYQVQLPPQQAFKKHRAVIKGSCGSHSFLHECYLHSDGGFCYFDIPDIQLWWPKNYGEPNLYRITVELFGEDGSVLAQTEQTQGFRTLKLRRTNKVEKGGCFEFVVNGVKIMAVGSNWVPMDVYHSRDAKRYQKALELANDVGCNILRCWGGNVYEDDAFFEYCDAHGIMVWQDFAMACAYYPQTKEFAEQIEQEVTAVAKKLRHYACLVLWCGDNEIDYMIASKAKPSVNYITREVIPRVLQRVDPYRPYIASSPYISDEAWALGNDYYPEDHLWGPRDYFKSNFYTSSNAYFVSETGYHGCPAKQSIEKFIDADRVWPYTENEQWNLHSTDQNNSPSRTMLMHRQVQQLFGTVPEEMELYIKASQISQAEAKKFFIERVRAKMSSMGGVIWWNLIDGWPQMSDAVVDYYYEKKLAYSYIKRSSRPVLALVGEMKSWGHPVLVANSTLKPAEVTVKLTDLETGSELFSGSCTAAPNANTEVGFLPMMYSDKGMLLIEYTVDGKPFVNTYLYGAPAFDLNRYLGWLQKVQEVENKL